MSSESGVWWPIVGQHALLFWSSGQFLRKHIPVSLFRIMLADWWLTDDVISRIWVWKVFLRGVWDPPKKYIYIYKIYSTHLYPEIMRYGDHIFFQKWCRNYVAMIYFKSTPLEILYFMKIRKTVKLYVHNQWRVVHNDITDYGGVANLKMAVLELRYIVILLCSLISCV